MESVLIIEDEEYYGEFLRRVVGKRYSCDWAKTAEQAKGFLGAKQYGIVLFDLRVPGASGRELIRYVKDKIDPDTVNIIITGYEDDWPAVEATEEHVFFYMRKGRFKNEELLKVLESADELRRLRRMEAEYVKKLVIAEQRASAGKLAVSIAHEINNPLQGMMSIMEVLKRRASEADAGDSFTGDLDIMEKSIDRIRRVVKQLTELHSIDAAVEKTDTLDKVVERVVSFIRPIAREKQTRIAARSSLGGMPLQVSEKQLFNILLNTFMNLLDGGYASIDVLTKKIGGMAALEITTARSAGGSEEGAPQGELEASTQKTIPRPQPGPATRRAANGFEITKGLLNSLHGSLSVEETESGEIITIAIPASNG